MIAKRSALVFANSVLGAAMGYIAIVLTARYMGAELVGARAYTLSIVFLGSVLTRLGLPVTHARRLAAGHDVGTSNGTFILLKVILTALFAALGFGAIWLWLGVLGHKFQDTTEAALVIGIYIVIAKSLRGISVNTFRGLGKFVARESVLFVNTFVTVTATAWVAIAYAVGNGRWVPFPSLANWLAESIGVTGPIPFETALIALLGAYLLGEVASLAVGWLLFVFQRIPVSVPNADTAKEYAVQALPLMLVNIAALTMANMDQLFIGFWWSAAEGGYYEVSAKLSRLILILASSINIVLMPYFARQFQDANHTGIRRATLLVERFLGFFVFPLAVFIFVYAPAVIHILLADDFLPAVWVLRILVIVVAVQSLTVPVRAKAIGKGESGLAAKTTWGAMGINLILDIVLIPKSILGLPMVGLGPAGAAIATLVAASWMAYQFRRRAHQWTGHPMFSSHMVRQIAAATGLGLLVWSFQFITITRIYHLLAIGVLFLGAYYVLLIALKELTKDDWQKLTRWARD